MSEKVAKLFITGDLVPLHSAGRNLVQGNIQDVFGTVLPVIQSADLAITNLETALTEGGTPIRKFGPNLRCPPDIIHGIAKAGFKLLALANNHSRDWGDREFIGTMATIKGAGLDYVGGGLDIQDAEKPYRTELNGLKLSVFNCTMRQPCCATANTPGANPLRPAHLSAQIAAEKDKADFVLVIVHDGKEHLPFPSQRIRDNYRSFIEAGANAVIAHHPHIPQGYETYRDGLIVYSLGNFQFPARDKDSAPAFWNRSYSVMLTIGEKQVLSMDVVPHFNDMKTDCINCMEGEMKELFLKDLERQNKILSSDATCDLYYKAAAEKFFRFYRDRIASDVHYFFHALDTEEHYDAMRAAAEYESEQPQPELPTDLDFYTF